MRLFALGSVIAASAALLAGCGLAAAQSVPAASTTHGKPAGYPAAFVASAGTGKVQGLAVFSAANGRLLHWLVRGKTAPVPVAVSPQGTWAYFYYPTTPGPRCPRDGFVEPVLWRVRVAGGRPQRTQFRTTDLAFSPDGKMTAYTSTRKCGQTLLIVVRNQRTGATRRIVAVHNDLSGNGPVFLAQLSWAPDDVHLAVATAPAAAINSLDVINALRATNITRAQPIPPCTAAGSAQVGCLDPGFSRPGSLTFLGWQEGPSKSGEWAQTWRHGTATRLFRLSKTLSFNADIAVDAAGSAILLEGHDPSELWRWSGGSLTLLRAAGSRLAITGALWLQR
jgi:hypothetical protein